MAIKILIIGSTGSIGKPITNQIISAKASFGRIAILTSQNTVTNKAEHIGYLREKGVDVLVGDLGVEIDVKNAYKGIPRDFINVMVQ